ncbi:MAG: dienelactone hydrolase family protein [Rhodobacteraceae bacterium]|nr:dienelactone hydrolase family protein [Paracoccaceae bacterium]
MAANIQFLWDGPRGAQLTVILAHGAGAPMDSPFMEHFAGALAAAGLRVGRFEFPYMAARRETGQRKPPDRAPVLVEAWRDVIRAHDPDKLVIGGKSMGGRIASMVADESNVRGLVCLGYPFYGMGRKDKPRIAHLETLKTKTLICQGERDPMGDKASIAKLHLSKSIKIFWLPDGDHDLKPRKASGRTHGENLADSVKAITDFLSGLR